jgi:Cu/Ag efflux pump CusA
VLNAIVDVSLKNRAVVLILAALAIVGGGVAMMHLPLDVVPDITNV